MTQFILEYAQPTISATDSYAVIFEKKTETLEEEEVSIFLRENPLVYGGVVYFRAQMSLRKYSISHATPPSPHPDFLALGDEFPEFPSK